MAKLKLQQVQAKTIPKRCVLQLAGFVTNFEYESGPVVHGKSLIIILIIELGTISRGGYRISERGGGGVRVTVKY